MPGVSTRPKRRFQLVLIKPSHYDDDGYVIQWARAFIPSNTLAVLYSLALDSAQRAVLGPDTAIDITVIDEIHTHVKIKRLLSQFRRHGGFGLVGIVGVQSNQYPARARYRPPVPRRRRAGDDRRIPRVRLPRHAARNAGRPQEDARHGRQHVRRRTGRADGPGPAGRGERDVAADLQLPEGSAVARVRADPDPPGRAPEKDLPGGWRASMPAAAVPINARSAPSSMSRAGNRGAVRRTMSSGRSASIMRKASGTFSSPTTISPATRTGRRSSTGSSSCANATRCTSG